MQNVIWRHGKPDVVVVHQGKPTSLLENQSDSSAGWVQVRFVGTHSTRDAVNVQCLLKTGTRELTREITTGGYLTTNEPIITIRLNAGETIKKFEVIWPRGKQVQFDSLPTNTITTIYESRGIYHESGE